MTKYPVNRLLSTLLALCLTLSLAACHKGEAASMWLVKTEGAVAVTDGDGGNVKLADRLGLFSGYQVGTETESYGWIDLDEVKLTKLDQDSEVEVHKDGKKLELVVTAGSLFFDITEPLEDDEELTIRSANMVTAIRGTSGWVTVEDESKMSVWILNGTVECSVQDDSGAALTTQSVTAWERAELDAADRAIEKSAFTQDDIPDFVRTERDLPDLNAYGAAVFEQREEYIPFEDLPPVYQTAVQDLVESRADLTDVFSTLDQSMRFFTTCTSFNSLCKVYFNFERDPDDPESGRLEFECRPESGMGLAYTLFKSPGYSLSGRYKSYYCEGWQWNGRMEAYDTESFMENGKVTDRVTLAVQGQLVDGLRQGTFNMGGHRSIYPESGSLETETIVANKEYTDGLGEDYRDGMTAQIPGVTLWGIMLNLGEVSADGTLSQYQLDMLYW